MIDSPTNRKIKLLRSLEQPRNVRGTGLFLVEGIRLFEDGLDSGFLPEIVLYTPDLLGRTPRGKRLLGRIAGLGERAEEATPRALEAASATLHPQGVVAAFPVVRWPPSATPAGGEVLALVCDNIQDPGNLGTILRTAEAAGVTVVWLSPGCAELYNPKVVRAGMGAHFRLPAHSASWDRIKTDLDSVGARDERVFTTSTSGTLPYYQVDWRGPSALVISNEAHGMSGEASRLWPTEETRIAIPMAGGTESLNAAIAAAVVLFEAARQRRNANVARPEERRRKGS